MLTEMTIRNAKAADRDYKLRDAYNLYLVVTKKGRKHWRMDYTFNGKRKTLAIGRYPHVSLRDARQACHQARADISNHRDPRAATCQELTFKAVAMEWFRVRIEGSSRSKSHQLRSLRMLEKELLPGIGHRFLSEISPTDVLCILRGIEERNCIDTAHRAKQTAGQVFRYAIASGYTNSDPTANLRDALRPKKKTHYASITDPQRVGQLLLAISSYSGTAVVRYALQLAPLLFLRPGELRTLQWSDVDWDLQRITIPADRMKMRQDHLVPVSRQAGHLLTRLFQVSGGGCFLFPSPRGASRPLSDGALRTALRIMGYDKQTLVPHGFRAMARTLLDEQLGCDPTWIEQQLGHSVKDANGRAYNRTRHLDQRVKMMQRWADYLDTLLSQAESPQCS